MKMEQVNVITVFSEFQLKTRKCILNKKFLSLTKMFLKKLNYNEHLFTSKHPVKSFEPFFTLVKVIFSLIFSINDHPFPKIHEHFIQTCMSNEYTL